ncbi:hypothetical protein RFM98_05780 [Mesorhizobium sp. VK9D]|uniref:hypothetical protein n=1 Tax=Mesorhizobium australafricanum TaxID=3072311 RepID=UPI002A24EF4E|nr:hypothetical protein [Mesorhizobium sp. VK9D]MDX8452260.1 hypothetical protein [Mesorhizobium sp. VK9D]
MGVPVNLQGMPPANANIAHHTNFYVEELAGRKQERGTFAPLAILDMLQIQIARRSLL